MLSVLGVLIAIPGCPTNKPPQSPTPWRPASPPYQRFVPITSVPASGFSDFALDTKTGQLCRTWKGQTLPKNERMEPLLSLPLCLDLYAEYPDQPGAIVTKSELPPGWDPDPGTRKINSSGDVVEWDGKQWKLLIPARTK
jgi:hypothetical protein